MRRGRDRLDSGMEQTVTDRRALSRRHGNWSAERPESGGGRRYRTVFGGWSVRHRSREKPGSAMPTMPGHTTCSGQQARGGEHARPLALRLFSHFPPNETRHHGRRLGDRSAAAACMINSAASSAEIRHGSDLYPCMGDAMRPSRYIVGRLILVVFVFQKLANSRLPAKQQVGVIREFKAIVLF